MALSPLRHRKKSAKQEDMEVEKQTRTITKEERSRAVLDSVLEQHALPALSPLQAQFVLVQIQKVLQDDGSLHDASLLSHPSAVKQQRLPSADAPEALFNRRPDHLEHPNRSMLNPRTGPESEDDDHFDSMLHNLSVEHDLHNKSAQLAFTVPQNPLQGAQTQKSSSKQIPKQKPQKQQLPNPRPKTSQGIRHSDTY
jgi:hypothetical protein